MAVVDAGGFTRAADRLALTQSAVSLQLKRLEAGLGARLMERDARRIRLTDSGETVLPLARRLLALNDDIIAGVVEDSVEGEVRFGAPEDFATVHLPDILGRFAKAHPRVQLNVTCDLTLNLLDGLSRGALDLCLIKRAPLGPDLGVRVWREPLVWVAGPESPAQDGGAAPLMLAPAPCVYRSRAIEALESIGRPWRMAYTSPSLAGQYAALRAGLGISVLPREMAPRDLRILTEADGLPRLNDAEVALYRRREATGRAIGALSDAILAASDRRA